MSIKIESRVDFQQLADDRLAEAKLLLDAGRWDGAYYLAGYAVELALKSLVIKLLMGRDAFPEKDLINLAYTHAFDKLLRLTRLIDARKAAAVANPLLEVNWTIADAWDEQKRYHRIDKAEADQLYLAISDPANGVLPWLKTFW